MRVLSYCVMPNHWHLVLWPERERAISQFMAWLTTTHALRWRWQHGTVGEGAVYQGRYKAIPVQCDRHFLTLCRYVERNPVRAGLVARTDSWPWSSAHPRHSGAGRPHLSQWPVPRPDGWDQLLNDAEDEGAVARLRTAVARGLPYGTPEWRDGLESVCG